MATGAPVDVTRVGPRDCPRAATCLTRAFMPDVLWSAVFPDPSVRHRRLTGMFRAMTHKAVHGGLPLTTPGIDAVAVWQPPHQPVLGPMVRSAFAEERWLLGLPRADRRRLTALFRRVEEQRRQHLDVPYWYLEAVGVDPPAQGHGRGGAVIRHGLRLADHAGQVAYLETETDALVSMYSGLGFRVVAEVLAPDVDVPVWLMRRDPEATQQR